jgi:hypothetical protein
VKDKPSINWVDDMEVCVAKWVNTAKDKLLACSFLRPSPGKNEEVKFTFDVITKCDKLLGVLLQNKVIRLSEGHVVPPPGQIAKGKYSKWHGTFSHTTNEWNYFRRQVQSALNNGQLVLGEGHKMKLDTDPFPMNVNMINFEEKRVLVWKRQEETTRGKNVIVSDEPRARVLKPRSPEAGVWKVNQKRWSGPRVMPTSNKLLEKYTRQQQSVFRRLSGVKRARSPNTGSWRAV